MKRIILITFTVLTLTSCAKDDDEKAQPLLAHIESLYTQGKYNAALDSITSLREQFPKAIEARKKALKIWQEASLKLAQKEVADTDIRMQNVNQQIECEKDKLKRNLLIVKRDSLKARYDAMCGVVRMIHLRQKQQ